MNWVDYFKGSVKDRPDSVLHHVCYMPPWYFFDYFKNFSVTLHHWRLKTEDRRLKTEGQEVAEDSAIVALLYSLISASVFLVYMLFKFLTKFFLGAYLYFKLDNLKYFLNFYVMTIL